MTTRFSTLPIVSLSVLSDPNPTPEALSSLSAQLDSIFSTTGFAYLVDLPITYSHEDIFGLCNDFFGPEGLEESEKTKLAKNFFEKRNRNTYRGYFPPQPSIDNLKEGFDFGPATPLATMSGPKINLTEPNVWPSRPVFKERCEKLHSELQVLSAQLLSLIAVALGKPSTFFDHYLHNSLSTLRLLHYPQMPENRRQELICTPHTDSGVMTLLHQDSTGGLEVANAAGEWVPVPYIPGSVVVNIGDLMSRVSSGRYVATLHRVRAGQSTANKGDENRGRYSVPFFLEPGAGCVVRSVNNDDKGVVYGKHLLDKLSKWLEFQKEDEEPEWGIEAHGVMIEAF